jgi:molybdenum cofactor sulfurtransferase
LFLRCADTVYLDHAGTTLYPKSLIDSFARELTSNLFGNPHSMSASSQLSTQRVDDIRLRALRFFNADPEEFDLVFVANATAAIKLVVNALQGLEHGFWYGYHVDAHTSLVGGRELARLGNRCFSSDEEVERWISGLGAAQDDATKLLAFPAQSNMNGRRLPIRWCENARSASQGTGNVFTLLDAASLVSTSQLDLSDVSAAPDFTALSFYKIFGFPDLGALIVRKRSAHILEQRKFFGGGTVDMVLAMDLQWHAKTQSSLHSRLEDGTLPFHNIIALDSAFEMHKNLYGSMRNVSSHCQFLAKHLYDRLSLLTHFNGVKLCQFYKHALSDYADPSIQGPIVAFNMRNSHGGWIGKSDVERLASVKNIQLRTGFLCNPGGSASSLGWTSAELRGSYSTGLRCGDDHDILNGRPTGVIRVSLGAMTNVKDLDVLLAFLEEFYVEKAPHINGLMPAAVDSSELPHSRFYIESLSVYPIKSCGAFKVPNGVRWEIRKEGLEWDREWCLVHQGTGVALNQKKYPRMALVRPFVDLDKGVLRVTCGETVTDQKTLEISLAREDTSLMSTSLCQRSSNKSSNVCGDQVDIQAYTSSAVSAFFSAFLGVPCTLARFPPQSSTRYSKLGSSSGQAKQRVKKSIMPGSFPQDPPLSSSDQTPILLSNESPILLISRSSVNRLNETIKATSKRNNGTGKAVAADVFRGNIVVAEQLSQAGNEEQPYAEDSWTSARIGPSQVQFDVLGSCQRCQMVCIDQFTGVRRDEPLSTLAKTRKVDGKILFGKHISISGLDGFGSSGPGPSTVMVGDLVAPQYDYE